jgi:hypothetical protein
MKRLSTGSRTLSRLVRLVFLSVLVAAPSRAFAEAPPAAISAFSAYIGTVESRLAQQHRSQNGFIAPAASASEASERETRLRKGESVIEQLTPSTGVDWPGAMLHDWRGTAFAPGATAADFERLMKDYNAYPRHFSPQVLQARVLAQHDDFLHVLMRVRQKHVITVVMDTAYDIVYGRLDAKHGYSISRSTQIQEIESPGSSAERVMGPKEEHGFLWRMNTYWSYEERDGGLYMQIESVSLTRSIPNALAWIIRPFVESIPRESLEFTLRAASNALRK